MIKNVKDIHELRNKTINEINKATREQTEDDEKSLKK